MIYIVKREKEDLIKFMKAKAEKMGLACQIENDKILVEALPGENSEKQTPIPVEFKGTISTEGENVIINGKYGHGFNLTTMVVISGILIMIRLISSVYQKQLDNIILCGIVTILLIVVVYVVERVGKPLKQKIENFFTNLEKK